MYEYYLSTFWNKQKYASYRRKSYLICVIPITMFYEIEHVSSFFSTCS